MHPHEPQLLRAHTQNITPYLPYLPASTCKSAAAATWLALFVLIHRLVASHQHLNKIPVYYAWVLGAGAGAGAGAGTSAGVLAEAAHKHQAEAALKLVQARPHKPLRNLIDRLRSKYVVV